MENKIKIPEDKRGLDPVVSSNILNIVNHLPFYVMLIDADHHILLVNNAVEKSLGVNPDQIIGKYCPKVVHWAQRTLLWLSPGGSSRNRSCCGTGDF